MKTKLAIVLYKISGVIGRIALKLDYPAVMQHFWNNNANFWRGDKP